MTWIDPDRLPEAAVEATDYVAGAATSPVYALAAFCQGLLDDEQAMMRAARVLGLDVTADVRRAFVAAVQV